MKRKIAAALAFATMSAMVVGAPAFAHGAGPCDDSGGPGHSDYARHHVSFLAKQGMLGAGGHIPGEHMGYSLCNPSGK